MRSRTASLHVTAERTGVVAAILADTVSLVDYALWLRNLLPAYQALERALWRHRGRDGMGFFAQTSLARAERIAADLRVLAGPDWPDALPLLPSGQRYASRIIWAGAGAGERLVAHAYTRYLGDLNGGQAFRQRLIRRFGPEFHATAFTEFPEIPKLAGFIAEFRAALDDVGDVIADPECVLEEAAVAFRLNIQISEDVVAQRA
jgi:heme oxygenase